MKNTFSIFAKKPAINWMQFADCKRLWDIKRKKAISTVAHSNFNYGCLIWHFSSKRFQNKEEKIVKEVFSFHQMISWAVMQNFFKNPHQHQLRRKDFVRWFMKFSIFMKDIFHYSTNVTHKKHNLYIHTQNTTKFGIKVQGLLTQTYGTHCLNILNRLLHC